MDYLWADLLGITGVILIVGTYLLLQLNRINSYSLSYSLFNGLGALLILISLIFKFNVSAFIIELFWVIISTVGIIRYFRKKKQILKSS